MAKLSKFGRFMAEEKWPDVVAACLLEKHPQSVWLANKRASEMNDATLTEAIARLEAWLETNKAQG